MQGFWKYASVTAAAVLLAGASTSAMAQRSARGSSSAQAPARLGGKPNLNGIWQTMGGANWDLEPHSAATAPAGEAQLGAMAAIPAGVGVVEGGTLPYKPEGLQKRAENRKNRVLHDPEAACYLPGIPRATYMDHAFQIIQGEKGDLLFAYEYHSANRAIKMRDAEIPPIDTWMGTSYGHWDGDVLEVVTLGQSPGDVKLPGGALVPGVTWLDRAGNYITNHATVTERFIPNGPNHMTYEVTIDDPDVYTKPWKMTMPLYRRMEPNAQLLEFNCVPFSEVFLYGDLIADKDKYPKTGPGTNNPGRPPAPPGPPPANSPPPRQE